MPGVAVGVYSDGREFGAGFGVTSTRNPLPVNEKTLFQIGSNTKTFVATAAMRLVEAGKLDLDTPIRKYLPDFRMRDPDVTERVTMRHLMTHTGGWLGDYFLETGDGDDALERYVLRDGGTAAAYAARHAVVVQQFGVHARGPRDRENHRQDFRGGAQGSGRRSARTAPLLHLPARRDGPSVRRRPRFGQRADLRMAPWALPRSSWPAGGIAASVMDLVRYGRFHLGDGRSEFGEKILSRESLTAMQTTICKGQFDTTMGLSWWLREAGGVKAVFHGGGTLGQVSAFNLYPRHDFAFAIFTNSIAGGALILEVTKDPMAEFLGHREPEPQQIPMSVEQLGEYVGRYIGQLATSYCRYVKSI